MATVLHALGRFSFRRRRLIALVWLVLLTAGIAGAVTLSGSTSSSLRVPGTEAQRALDRLAQSFPNASAAGATARVVFAAPSGTALTDPAYRQAVTAIVTEVRTAPQVSSVTDPFTARTISADATIGLAQITYRVPTPELTEQAHTALQQIIERGRAGGLTVEVGGDAVQPAQADSVTEVVGVVVAALVLLITFRSVIVAGLSLLTAFIGVGIGMTAILTLTGFVELSETTPVLALMIGLAVAIDYALLIVSRYRQELAEGRSPEAAAGQAVGTAGSAVVFAGLTVIIALTGLTVIGVPFLTQMGLGAAGTVAIAVLIAITLLPALFGFAGRRVTPAANTHTGARPSIGNRWARLVTRRPVTVLMVTVAGLGITAVPALDLRLGLPGDGMAGPQTTQRRAYDLVSRGFGSGSNGPLVIVVSARDAKAAADKVTVSMKSLPGVAAVSPAVVNATGDTAVLQVVPARGPNDTATTDLVAAIRSQGPALHASTGASVAVTGLTAINIDMSAKLANALLPYLLLVVGLAFLLLMLVFRSILVPLKAALGFLLTVGATFGAIVAVFQWGWLAGLFGVAQTGPIVSVMPIILIGVVFGLAMDYQVFLVTRIREEYVHGATADEAIIEGFTHGARVVTAAAIIMISVFTGFVFADDAIVKMVGFGLGFAVLVDAFIVRMTIVPAGLALLGRSAWWLPAWLGRSLPSIDVEGEKLRDVPADLPSAVTAHASRT